MTNSIAVEMRDTGSAEGSGMNVLIVVESCFGNTAHIAESVAEGIRARGGSVTVVGAHTMPALDDVDLLLVGAPTHNAGLSTPTSRRQAEAHGAVRSVIGVREWLDALPARLNVRAAAFDTVAGRSIFTGSAARRIVKRLQGHACDVLGRESFLVVSRVGPLVGDESARAERWGSELADRLSRFGTA